jgi:hypothetical protein
LAALKSPISGSTSADDGNAHECLSDFFRHHPPRALRQLEFNPVPLIDTRVALLELIPPSKPATWSLGAREGAGEGGHGEAAI